MADPINKAQRDAAKRALAAQTAQKAAARETVTKLEPQIGSARQFVNVELPQTQRLSAQYAANNPDFIERYLINRILPESEQKGTKLTTEIINPYEQAMGVLAQPDIKIPDAEYAKQGAALDAILASLAAIGVEGLAAVMSQIREEYPDISSEDALLLLKFDSRYNKPYMTRFSGNKMRMDAGFAPLDDKEYLANEAAFSKIFTAYGIEKQFANRAEYARQIGNRVAPQELAERVSLGYDRLTKGATETLKAVTTLFPELTDKDLLAYAIDPVNQLPAITRKVQAAEIGGAALAQNLTIGLTTAPTTTSGYTNVARRGLTVDELLAQGVDLQTARRGFAKVAEVLPTAEKLSAIYGGTMQQYGREEAEQEQFKGLASARRKREELTQREIDAFSGETGAGQGAFAKERSF